MEESGCIFVDPEEEEIYFHRVTERRPRTTRGESGESVRLDMKAIISDAQSEKNNLHSANNCEHRRNSKEAVDEEDEDEDEEEEGGSDSKKRSFAAQVETNGDDTPGKSIQLNNLIDFSDQDVCRQSCEENGVSVPPDYYISPEREKREKDFLNDRYEYKFTSPGKTVIDKSILRTPKSIVKADKDGGFLKVLSEIALVKAEADENSLKDCQKLFGPSQKSELSSDDNKENKQSEADVDVVMKMSEASPPKSHQNSSVKKLNYESNKQRTSCGLLGKLNADNMGVSGDNEKSKASGVAQSENTGINSRDLIAHEDASSNDKKSDELRELEIVFEKFNDVSIAQPERKSPKHVELIDISGEGETRGWERVDNGPGTTEKGFAEKGTQFKSFNEQTRKLFEELYEIVNSDEARGDLSAGRRFSADARTVVDLMRAAGIDDSMCSPDQYFDLDKINNSLFGAEITDVLNDTFSKSLNQITSKDLEMLLGKLAGSNSDKTAKTENETKIKSPCNASAACRQEKPKTPSGSRPRAVPANRVREEGRKDEPKPKMPVKATPVQYKSCKNPIRNAVVQSENKFQKQPPVHQTQNKQRGCQSVEKNFRAGVCVGTPKPSSASSTSRIPVNSTLAKRPNFKMAATPGAWKSQKSLKFGHIESPVHAYINSKESALAAQVAAKSEPAFGARKKNADNTGRSAAKLPFVQYRSAIPFKVDATGESRLPRPGSRMKKVVNGNSPAAAAAAVVANKHEGRMQLGAKKAGPTNDATVPADPNPESLLVSKSKSQQ